MISTSSNGQQRMSFLSSFLRICLLIAALQIYIIICSLIFQKLENQDGKLGKPDVNVIRVMKQTLAGSNSRIKKINVADLKKAFKEDERNENKRLFHSIHHSYLFTLMSFTTLGNSGLQLTTWQARLFYIFTIPFGFALYIVIIISLAYHLRNVMQECVSSLQKKQESKIEYLNIKILAIAFVTASMFLQIGGIVSVLRRNSYLDGLYISVDLMVFVGNEVMLKRDEIVKIYILLFFGLYLMLMHCILLVFISSCCHAWKEVSEVIRSTDRKLDCFKSPEEPLEADYKEKLLASFDSSSSGTPPNEHFAEDEAYFPQFKEDVIFQNLDLVDCASSESRDSRFSEIFNAQKNNFEPIHESNEATDMHYSNAAISDGGISDGAISDGGLSDGVVSHGGLSDGALSHGGISDGVISHGAISNISSVKSNDEIIAGGGNLTLLRVAKAVHGENVIISQDEDTARSNLEHTELELEEDLFEDKRAVSRSSSTPSIPSSYSNISVDEWEKEEDGDGMRPSSPSELEMALYDDLDNTLVYQ